MGAAGKMRPAEETDLRGTIVDVIAREIASSGLDEVDARTLRDDTDFYADLGADELDIITIVMALERDLAIELSDDACDGIRTIGDIVATVRIAQARQREAGGG